MRTVTTGTDGEAVREAMFSLRTMDVNVPAERLQEILREQPDPGARMLAVEMLADQRATEAVAELKETARRDKAWPVRATALQALAALNGESAREELRTAMRTDVDPQVRVKALRELHGLLAQDEQELVELLEKALTDPATIVRLQASRYMARVTGLSAPPDLRGWQEARSQ
jgi:HEAT repeat protein